MTHRQNTTRRIAASRTAAISASAWARFMDMTEPEQDAFLAEAHFAVSDEPFDPGADKYIIGAELKMTYTHCASCGVELPTPYTDGEDGEAFCPKCIAAEIAYRESDDQPEEWELEANAGPTLVEIRQYVGDGPDAVETFLTVEATPLTSPSYWMTR